MPTTKPKPAPTQIRNAEPKSEAKRLPQVPGLELTETQRRACDLAADLIVNGGDEDDVYQLLFGLLGHSYRRQFPNWPRDPVEREKRAEEHSRALSGRWYTELARQWPEPIAQPAHPTPPTVMEMARDNARRQLQRVFYADYLGGAPMEDVYLLREILEDAQGSKISLPEAFAYQIDADHTWVKVPSEHVKRVKQFIELVKGDADAA